mmetsp:Transcript_43544/g.102315  ORF Transcript_43544/g.102315 Transcript_43544/m.102315 type:complete len:212 (-) Transcript_43544:73-708(-)
MTFPSTRPHSALSPSILGLLFLSCYTPALGFTFPASCGLVLKSADTVMDCSGIPEKLRQPSALRLPVSRARKESLRSTLMSGDPASHEGVVPKSNKVPFYLAAAIAGSSFFSSVKPASADCVVTAERAAVSAPAQQLQLEHQGSVAFATRQPLASVSSKAPPEPVSQNVEPEIKLSFQEKCFAVAFLGVAVGLPCVLCDLRSSPEKWEGEA